MVAGGAWSRLVPEKDSAKKEELFHPHFEAPRLAV
jgi:hypothetical protein